MKRVVFLSLIILALASLNASAQITASAISGTMTVGSLLSASYTGTIGGTSTVEYEWFYSDNTSLGVSGNHTITAIEEGKIFYVKAQEYNAGHVAVGSAIQSPSTGAVNYRPVSTTPSVSGTAAGGQILFASYTYSDTESDPESGSRYRWYRSSTTNVADTVFIPGATSLYYLITGADYNKYLAVSVKPVSSAGSRTGVIKVSSFTSRVTNSAPFASVPVLSGTTRVGEVLTAAYTYSDADGDPQGASKYQWYRTNTGDIDDTVLIAGATSIFYKLTNNDYNNRIAFAVIPYAQTGNTGGARVSSALSGVILNDAPAVMNPGIATPGSLNVNDVLVGTYTYSDTEGDPEQNSVYQWLSSDINDILSAATIPFATSVSYKLTLADTGKYIFFSVTPKAASGNTTGTAVSSAGTGTVNTPPYARSVGISGLMLVDQTITGTYVYGDFDKDLQNTGATIFRWYSNGSLIPGATSQTYLVTEEDEGKKIKFEVIPVSNTGFPSEGLPASYEYPTAVPASSSLPVADQLCIDGIRKAGNTITGKYHFSGTSNDSKYRFRWMRDNDTIPGETSKTYKLVSGDIDRNICFVVYPVSKNGTRRGLTAKSASLARIEMVKAEYFSTDRDTTLSGSPTGGTFYGDGVLNGKFRPSSLDYTKSPFTINYQIINTLPSHTCQQTHPKSVSIIDVNVYYDGLEPSYCTNDGYDTVQIKNLPPGVVSITFSITSPGGIESQWGDKIVLDPSKMRAGYNDDYLIANCMGLFGPIYIRPQPLIVYLAPEITVEGLKDNQIFCKNDSAFQLKHNQAGGTFTGRPIRNVDFFDPAEGNTLDTVIYNYVTSTGCDINKIFKVVINPAPEVSFSVKDACITGPADSTEFTNTTIKNDVIKSWKWEFFESGGSFSDTTFAPKHLYRKGGTHIVNLTATTIKDCDATLSKTIDLGNKPEAGFYWLKECLAQSGNNELHLLDKTFSESAVDSTIWKFPDGSVVRRQGLFTDTTRYLKKKAGYLDISYIVKTKYLDCHDTSTQRVYIRPTRTISADSTYLENFEKGNGGWVPYNEKNEIWAFGKPGRTVIDKASSGINAWYTKYPLSNQKKDSASIISPCFDFKINADRPMIKMMLWKRFDRDRDGAVLQYKIGDTPGWNYVGTIDDGINWFNSPLIKGKPGDGTLGWTAGSGNSKDAGYVEASNKLDSLVGEKDVKFRIAYASDGTSVANDGIAFDSIWIGSRTRGVLVEHFTNNSSSASTEPTRYVSGIAGRWVDDVINIQYHTNFPGSDPYYNVNPADASARFLFYGLSKAPYTFIDGGTDRNNFASFFDYTVLPFDSTLIYKRSLVNPLFKISMTVNKVSAPNSSDRLEITAGKVEALKDINVENLTLFIAVTQKNSRNGSKDYYNVFRKFLPNAGGLNMPKTMTRGSAFSIEPQIWVISGVETGKDIEVIVFVQNNITKQIYQAESEIVKSVVVGIEDNIVSKNAGFSIWPNPSAGKLTVEFDKPLNSETDILICDFSGTLVKTYRTDAGVSEYVIDNHGLKNGIYLVRISSGGTAMGYRKLVVSQNR